MPEEDKKSGAAMWERIVQQIINGLLLALGAYLAYLGNHNSEKISSVETRQVEAVESADKVRKTIDTSAEVISKKSADEAQATAINLWSVWRYLDGLAAETGNAKDKEKAAEARKVYDEFVKKNPKH